ncbi:MAG: DUF456 family protein [Candidatus Omnitrophota bacterium]
MGGVLGAIAGTAAFGVGVFIGALLGIFIGAFLVELFIHKDLIRSFKAGAGGVLGRVGSIAAKVVILLVMFYVMISNILAFY